MKCFFITSLCWIALIAISYSYIVTNQILIVPNQAGYMVVKNHTLEATPINFEVTHKQDDISNLIQQVSK